MYFDDIKLGTVLDLEPAYIHKDRMLAFAREYDHIPLHTDEEYAAQTPFGGLIAPGVMSFMAVWSKYLEQDLFGPELLAGKSTKIEWVKPVYAGDALTGRAEVTGLIPRNGRNGIVVLTIQVRNQHGQLVLTNITEAIVKRKCN